MEIKPKKRWSTLKKIIVWSSITLGVAFLGIAAKFTYDVLNPQTLFNVTNTSIDNQVENTVSAKEPASTDSTAAASPTLSPEEQLALNADTEIIKNRVNILMLGLDESTEREKWGSFRTDTMIMLSIDFANKKVDMISIPRDSYVRIYNKEERGKINSAFPTGGGAKKKGFQYACKTVEMLFGNKISIEYYVGFGMNVVKDVVNAINGVDYDVDINVDMNGRTLSPGFQHLDGQAVLDYCRMRHGSSDIMRVSRQQKMLVAIFKQMASAHQLVNIPGIYQAIEKNIQTNLNITQISALALFATKLSGDRIVTHIVDGEFLNMDNVSYWGVSVYKLKSLAKEVFEINIPVNQEDDVNYIKQELEKKLANAKVLIEEGNSLIAKVSSLIANYGSSITPTEKESLNQAIEAVNEAAEDADNELLTTSIASLKSIYNSILVRLGLSATSVVQPTPAATSTTPSGIIVSP